MQFVAAIPTFGRPQTFHRTREKKRVRERAGKSEHFKWSKKSIKCVLILRHRKKNNSSK